MLNSETTLVDFPEPESFWLARERPRLLHLPQAAAGTASLPAAPGVITDWPPPRLPWVFLCCLWPRTHARGVCLRIRVQVGGGARSAFSFGSPISAPCRPAHGFRSHLQADLDPISCPPFPSGLPRRKMVPEAGGSRGMTFFFLFFLFFLNKGSFLYNHELRGPCTTPATTRPPRSFQGGETGGSRSSPRR